MKQRLLLALLVLFASVGMVKANITFKVPKTIGTVTVTVTGEGTVTGTGVEDKKNGTFVISGEGDYTISGEKITKLTFSTTGGATITEIKGDGMGILNEIDANNVGLANIQLDLSGLTKLNISNNLLNADNTKGNKLPNLKEVNLSENKFIAFGMDLFASSFNTKTSEIKVNVSGNSIPWFGDSEKYNVTWGTQKIPYTGSAVQANVWFDPVKILVNDGKLFKDNPSYTYKDLKISWKAENGSSSITTLNNTTDGHVKFYSGSTWFSGDAVCTIELAKGNGPKIERTIQVSPAKFKVETKVTTGKGKIGVFKNGTEISEVQVNDNNNKSYVTITATPDAGYIIDNTSLKTPGFTKDGDNGYKVTGITTGDNLLVEAGFKAIEYTVNHSKGLNADKGTYEIKCDGKEVATGSKWTYDKVLNFEAIPNEGFKARVFIGEKEVAVSDNKATITLSDYVSKTTAGTVTIKVDFEAKDNYTINFKEWDNNAIKEVKINTTPLTSVPADGNITIVPGNKVSIEVTCNDGYQLQSILIDGVAKSSEAKYTFEMPKKNIIIGFVTVQKKALTVEAKPNVTYTYTGSYQDFEYIVKDGSTIVDITDFKVEYSRDGGITWNDKETGKPKEVGSYKVKMTRAAKDGYAKFENKGLAMNIVKAKPTLSVPTVSVNTNNEYVISGGSAKLNNITVAGKFKVSHANDGTSWIAVTDGKCTIKKSHNVKLIFEITDKNNFDNSDEIIVPAKYQSTDAIETFKLTYKNIPSDMTLKVYNGSADVTSNVNISVGTELKFVLTYPKGFQEVYLMEEAANAKQDFNITDNGKNYTVTSDPTYNVKTVIVTFDKKPADITVKFNGTAQVKELTVKMKDDKVIESEFVKEGQDLATLCTDKFTISLGGETLTEQTSLKLSDVTSKMVISYKDNNDNKVVLPTNVGKYTICVYIPAIAGSNALSIKETKVEFEDKLEITPKEIKLDEFTWPERATVGIAQTLEYAVFMGEYSAPIDGKFVFVDGSVTPKDKGKYEIKFEPTSSNYKVEEGSHKAAVTVSNQRMLLIDKLENGTITVKGNDGVTYKSGDALPLTVTSVTITATPSTGHKLATLTVNGTSISSGSSYKLGETSITIAATFDAYYKVNVTKSLKGAIITLPSSNEVKKGESYTFTVAALAADMSKIVVKDGSTTVAGSNGKYTISNITADKAITITLDNPTAITVKADTTMSPGHKPMDEITVEGVTNGKCYYGDKVTVKAEPVQGVTFAGWTGTTETTSTFSFVAKEASYHFKAKYSGSPVGIEAIEGVKIYGTKGAIVINCDSDASVIIISMNGQSRQVEISGDTRIPAGAGIYGVVFQKGAERIQTKVMVR